MTLRALQSRIRESKGADRGLDWIIANTFQIYRDVVATGSDVITHLDAPKFTASLDACVALLNAKFPGATWIRTPHGTFRIWDSEECAELLGEAFPNDTDCHTFLDAIVSAEISKLETTETTGA